ncbi:MAG: response regulator [Lachnospiraceae bacterium]|nr:response regulator [Lachnospiraceae bacterium]
MTRLRSNLRQKGMVVAMLKVVIADDEERICRLIQALMDWNALQMEVAGVASNGLEAIELVEELHPDILITDIRMPGCDGLELIQNVKKSNPQLEIVIISGYAHFSYAQTAMRYGVGNYLLKPINKLELTQTLEKLRNAIADRNETESDIKRLLKNSENDRNRMKHNLIWDLLEKEPPVITLDALEKEYYLQVKPGIFQGFCLKFDFDMKKVSEAAQKVVFEKAVDIIKGNMKPVCYELVLCMGEHVAYGILNYAVKNQSDVRRIMRDCLNQLTVQKSILGPIDFSMAMGIPVKRPEELAESLKGSTRLIQERILVGTGHVIEKMAESTGLQDSNLLEDFSRKILHALEVLSVDEAAATAGALQNAVTNMRNIRGYEIFELVKSAGNLFLMQIKCKDRNEKLRIYEQQCDQSGTITELFQCLIMLQTDAMEQMKNERENDALRPIRLAKQYIQNHYSEQITLEQVSDVVGLSSGYFSVLFKKEIGEGFAKYLINIRIEQAKILLRETNGSVSDICKKVGYNDLKHFTHTFDKATGLKPGAYRKLYG